MLTIRLNENIEVVKLSNEIVTFSVVLRAKTGMRLPDAMVMFIALHEKVY